MAICGTIRGIKKGIAGTQLFIGGCYPSESVTYCLTITKGNWTPYVGDQVRSTENEVVIYSGDMPFPYTRGQHSTLQQGW